MYEKILKLIKKFRKENRGGKEHKEILEDIKSFKVNKKDKIKIRWWLFYSKINKTYNTKKFIFCKKVYPIFTGLKFSLGEKI